RSSDRFTHRGPHRSQPAQRSSPTGDRRDHPTEEPHNVAEPGTQTRDRVEKHRRRGGHRQHRRGQPEVRREQRQRVDGAGLATGAICSTNAVAASAPAIEMSTNKLLPNFPSRYPTRLKGLAASNSPTPVRWSRVTVPRTT